MMMWNESLVSRLMMMVVVETSVLIAGRGIPEGRGGGGGWRGCVSCPAAVKSDPDRFSNKEGQ